MSDGVGRQAPVVVDNRPGLGAIGYRIGTHSRFKASMLARLSGADLPALAGLTTRADRDLSIALLDAWASVSDIVAFYQERIANEAYVRTATERRSVAELAALIGYVPRPGIAASAHLAFTLEDTGGTGDVPVPLGTRVQSIPAPGERPQAFETIEAISGRPEFNSMRPQLLQPHPPLTAGTKVVTVVGTAVNVRRGDSVLIASGAGSGNRNVKRVLATQIDATAGTTRLELAPDPPDPPPLRFILAPAALWDPAPRKLTSTAITSRVLSGSWRQADLKAYTVVQRWPVTKLAVSLLNVVRRLLPDPLAADSGVFAFRQRASVFGHNAPPYATLPNPKPQAQTWENLTLSQEPGGQSSGTQVDLDNVYSGVVKGSWLVLEDQFRRDVFQVQDTAQLSRAAFTLASKVTRVKLNANTNFASYGLRTTSVLAESDRLELAPLPVTDDVVGNRLVLDRAQLGLEVGRPVVVTGERTDLEGVTDSEVVTLADVVFNEGRTELVFTTSLQHSYARATVTVNANVALATHGQATDEALGSGDANVPFQAFTLAQGPLTYVPARSDTGGATTLEVRVNELLWQEVGFLYGHGPDDHVYITREDDDRRTHVVFGDGRTGARVPSGQENVRARYRRGMGAEGLVRAGQLALPATRPLGVRGVVNPLDAGDAADRDGLEDVRRNAALPTRTLDRIVSLTDYEDFARAFSGVAKALATWTWDGLRQGVFLTVAGAGGAEIPATGLTATNLLAAARAAGDPAVPLLVASYTPAFFRVAADVRLDPAYRGALVLPAVEAALRAAFSFDARDFGGAVARSEVVAAMQAVPGVVAVDLTALYRTDAAAGVAEELTAGRPRAGTNVTVPAELLLLDPRPVELGVLAA